jgi:hypothetical protein
MATTPKRPRLHEDARVIRELPVAQAANLFVLTQPQVVYIERCRYRRAEFGGYFLAAVPPYAYRSGTLPKRYMKLYLRWFNWQPPEQNYSRVTLLTTPEVAPLHNGLVVTDLGLDLSDIHRQL